MSRDRRTTIFRHKFLGAAFRICCPQRSLSMVGHRVATHADRKRRISEAFQLGNVGVE
jgi:hypothetical protein